METARLLAQNLADVGLTDDVAFLDVQGYCESRWEPDVRAAVEKQVLQFTIFDDLEGAAGFGNPANEVGAEGMSEDC